MVLSGFLNEQMKIVVIKTCDLQESTQKQFNKIRKPIHKQNEKFNREVEITKKNQTEILELKNTTKVMNNKKENINRRINQPKKESVKQKRDYLKLCSPPGSSVHAILQARILEWVAMPSSTESSWPRDWTHVSYISCIGRWVLYH